MKKILQIADKTSTIIAATLFGIMTLIMAYNIITRALHGGISWYMETSQYLNVWAVFIAGIGLCATSDHLRIDAIEGFLKGTPKKILRVVIGVITCLFYVMLGVGFILLATKSKQTISTLEPLKMSLIYWPIPFICWLSAIAALLRCILEYRDPSVLIVAESEEVIELTKKSLAEELGEGGDTK